MGAIRLTHTSDSTETCSGSVQLAITDPDVIEPTPEWVQVYDGAVWGLVNDGTNWWTTEGDNGQTVSKRDADWDELTTFEADAVGGGSNTTRGITFDGSDLWVTGDEEAYARYSTAGSLEVTRSLTGWSGELRVRDIAWDGTDLWIGGGDTNRVRRWSTAGVVQQTIVLGFSPTGIAFHDGRLFIANGVGASEIVVYETDGTQVTTIDVSGSGINPHGIWIDTDGTLYIARDDSGVYRRTEKVSV